MTDCSKKCEILAPAGGEEQLRAAVICGADAVYFGVRHFNARAGATNFDEKNLADTVSWCHARGVKTYITLNTLIKDSEISSWLECLDQVANAGADGVIIQDIGMAPIIRKRYPTLPIHASTQLVIHNVAGAKMMEEMGFSKIIIARECSREEIKAITESTTMETEVFIHGALCMSVSGECYLSSMLGERSGNRGQCAQPCRLNFTNREREYVLSLKDQSLIERLPDLVSLGVSSFKIEGRLKRPEYVAAAVTACREVLEGRKPDMKILQNVFSRGEFTEGYYLNRLDINMFGIRTRDDVEASSEALPQLAALTRNEIGHVPVRMEFEARAGKSIRLTVHDGTYSVSCEGSVPEAAQKLACDMEYVKRSLTKTGGTPFRLDTLSGTIEEGLMISLSELNHLRKECLEQLEKRRSTVIPHNRAEAQLPAAHTLHHVSERVQWRCRFQSVNQIFPSLMGNDDRIILPIEEILEHESDIQSFGDRIIGEIPLMVWPGEEPKIKNQLKGLKNRGYSHVLCGNMGAIQLARETGLIPLGDYGLNCLNSHAVDTLAALGCEDATLSFEFGYEGLIKLKSSIPFGIICYGYLPLMTYRNCPGKGENGCGNCHGINAIVDRRGIAFSVLCQKRQYSQMLNSKPLFLSDRISEWKACSFMTLRFTTESRDECQRIRECYETGANPPKDFTRGLYYRTLK